MSDDDAKSLGQFENEQRARLDSLRSQLYRESAAFRDYLDVEAALRVIEQNKSGSSSRSARRGTRTQTSAFIAATTEIMSAQGWLPIPVSELHESLKAHGIEISQRNLSSRLSSSDQFISLGAQGWVLGEEYRPDGTQSVDSSDEASSQRGYIDLL